MVSWIGQQRAAIIERLRESFEPYGIEPKAPNPLAEADVAEGSFRGYAWVGLERITWQASEGRPTPTQKGEAIWTIAIGHTTLESCEALVTITQARLIGFQIPTARAAIGLVRSEYEGVDRSSRRIWQWTVQVSVPIFAVADNEPIEPEPLAKAIVFSQLPTPPIELGSDGKPVDPSDLDPSSPDPDTPAPNPHDPNSNPHPPQTLIIPNRQD